MRKKIVDESRAGVSRPLVQAELIKSVCVANVAKIRAVMLRENSKRKIETISADALAKKIKTGRCVVNANRGMTGIAVDKQVFYSITSSQASEFDQASGTELVVDVGCSKFIAVVSE